jgi:hypothetical protein
MTSLPNFRSKFEEDVYNQVIKNNLEVLYETNKIPYTISNNYLPDFILPNGIIVECKGYFDIRSQVKMRAVKKDNPHLDIRFVFMNSRTKVRKGSKLTYADWCDRYGYPYADGMIPLPWFKEKRKKYFTYNSDGLPTISGLR